jgi:PAS domain S-box-containing protein
MAETGIAQARDQLSIGRGLVPLNEILCTNELWCRPTRPADYETENRALGRLVAALAQSPRTILQSLADTLLEVFDADSAGMSLLIDEGKYLDCNGDNFCWAAIAGAWSPLKGGGTPRGFGPCSDVLDRNCPLLFKHWERRYPYLAEATPLAEEGLLVPFYVGGKAVGTIWTLAHSDRRKFDAEDLRQLESMARFASAAYQSVQLLNEQEASRAALENMEAAARSKQLLSESEHRFQQLLQALPAAVYTTDSEGRITFYNEAAAEFAGRRPELGEFWCVTWRLYNADGSRLPHEECPMAVALKENRPVRGAEAIAERPDGTRRWFAPYPTPLRDSAGRLSGAINMLVDITERKDAERQQKLFIDELNHRVKNTLATVQSIVAQAARSTDEVGEFQKAIEGRILALSHAHNQLSERHWADAELSQLVRSGLEPYLGKGQVLLSGDAILVPPRAALMLSMAVHELATNAVKYGALSSSDGSVELSWAVKTNGAAPRLRLCWLEQNGPPVAKPTHKGFGARLLEHGIETELGGNTLIEFAPNGLRFEIDVPLSTDDG